MRNLEHGERWDLRLILDRLEDVEFEGPTACVPVTSIELKTLKAVLTELLNEKRFKVSLP